MAHPDGPGGDLPRRGRPDRRPAEGKGAGELGISGVPAAMAKALYNATGIRVRDYPITLDKLLDRLPRTA
jgi:xanthine dehydrogenase YagR molybdenum-binding subunit